jgi:hypothetical protein
MKPVIGKVAAAVAVALMAGSVFVSAGEAEPKQAGKLSRDLAMADNEFGLKLFKQLHKDGQNTFRHPGGGRRNPQRDGKGHGHRRPGRQSRE